MKRFRLLEQKGRGTNQLQDLESEKDGYLVIPLFAESAEKKSLSFQFQSPNYLIQIIIITTCIAAQGITEPKKFVLVEKGLMQKKMELILS